MDICTIRINEMTEKTREICLEAIALLGKSSGVTEVRVCQNVEKDSSVVVAALLLSKNYGDGKKVVVYALGDTPGELASKMLEYINQYAGDPIAEEVCARRFARAIKNLEWVCEADVERLISSGNTGLVIVDGIHSLHVKEQGSFYESLMEYTETTGVPAISIRKMCSAGYEKGFAVGKVNRKLVDWMLEVAW